MEIKELRQNVTKKPIAKTTSIIKRLKKAKRMEEAILTAKRIGIAKKIR